MSINPLLYTNPLNVTTYEELSDQRRYEIAFALEKEYRGEGHKADHENILDKITNPLSQTQLDRMSCYVGIYPRIVKSEANSYAQKGFKRKFTNGRNKDIGDKEQSRLDEIYWDDLNSAALFLTLERRTIFTGTQLLTLTADDSGRMRPIILDPTIQTLKITPNQDFPGEIETIEYSIIVQGAKNKIKHRYYWDSENYIKETLTGSDLKTLSIREVEPHGYDGVPFAILKYEVDNRRIWGPVDYSAYSFFQTRSLMLSDSILRTQTSLFNILLFNGFTPQEALQSVKDVVAGKLIVSPEAKPDGAGGVTTPDVRYISPNMVEPSAIFDLYQKIYTHFLQSRGHTPKNFEVGADVQSAEAQRLSDVFIRSLQQERRIFLQGFEKQVFNLIRWKNNQIEGKPKISDKTEVIVDWADTQNYVNSTEKVLDQTHRLRQNMTTVPQLMQEENPDLSEDDAVAHYEKNMKYNQQFNRNPLEKTEEEKDKLRGLLGVGK